MMQSNTSKNKTGKHDPNAYPRENNLVYRVALGKTCKQWLIDNGFSPDEEIRAHLSEAQLKLADDLLAENATMIKLGMTYHQRRAHLEQTALDIFHQDENKRSKVAENMQKLLAMLNHQKEASNEKPNCQAPHFNAWRLSTT